MELSFLLLLFSFMGLISILETSITLLTWAHSTFFRPPKDLKKVYGSWAVVTGATDGIGKALAFELARAGLNLVLVGRNPDKLAHVSNAIKAESSLPTTITTVVVDLSCDLKGGIERLEAAIGGLDVGVLVNCAGVSYPKSVYFHEAEDILWEDVVRVNVVGTTMVSWTVIKGMMKRRRGAVVNIGSGASVVVPSFPLAAVYAATKSYITQLSRSIYVEYKDMGIDVQCQAPLFVATKMVSSFKRASTFVPSPDDYARAAIRRIGYEPICVPYWTHSVQWGLARLFPDFFLDNLLLREGISLRTRALNKSLRKGIKVKGSGEAVA